MKLSVVLVLLLGLLVSGCSSDSTDSAEGDDGGARITDRVELVTQMIHRDAALLSLFDAGLGKPVPARVGGAVELARTNASARIETAADLLEEWGEEVPVTVRDHGIDHGIEVDAPELVGAPTQDEIHALADSVDFAGDFTALFRAALESTRDTAASYAGDDSDVMSFADGAERSSQDTLDAFS
ncbi:hypothetical protein ncot_03025 [Nocardioides sp. JQ2195]|uniref:hypothetical protein n=1 Tax=Nocardioides sp. JQ2195 TaxID=2592334 RepID=UPI00143E561B|nr:hypothetical protein [Nocardioides sp. JQ2195]QIX25675.1 hypothetical protein ncot_03025 [Nocardioides sp. JQ2195]